MAKVELTSGPTILADGLLQLQNGVAMDATLRNVADQSDTTSTLQLSTGETAVVGALRFPKLYAGDEGLVLATGTQPNPANFPVESGATLSMGTYYNPNGTDPLRMGYGNTYLGIYSSAIGADNSYFNTMIGYAASITINQPGNVVIGKSATSTTNNATAIGRNASVLSNAYEASAIGYNASTSTPYGFAIGNGNSKLQIGGNFVPTARVHVKGSGSTSATTSLLVQNSGATNLLQLRDDGALYLGTKASGLGTLVITTHPTNGSKVVMQNEYGNPIITQQSTDVLTFGGQGTAQISGYSSIKFAAPRIDGNSQGGAGGSNYNLTIGSNSYASSPSTPAKCLSLSGVCVLQSNGFVNAIDLRPNFSFDSSNGRIAKGFYYEPTLTNPNTNDKHYGIQTTAGGAYINTTTPQDSACLQADSTTQGFLPPRMTDAEVRAIPSPAEGLVAYNTTISHLCVYQAGAWVKLSHSPM